MDLSVACNVEMIADVAESPVEDVVQSAGFRAMYPIGIYAIPQIKSVNPDMNIGSFTFPANDEESDNVLNSGIDFQDHHYPSEMSVDAMVQTFLLDTSDNAQEKLLKKFDSDWKRYNRDLIRKVQDYQKEKEEQL